MDLPEQCRTARVGVLLDDRIQEGWVAEALRQALAVPGVCLGAIALIDGAAPLRATPLFEFVDRLDRRLRCRGERLYTHGDVTVGLSAPVVQVDALVGDDGWSLPPRSVARLQLLGLDVWLCFVSRPVRRPLARIAVRGVWSLEIGPGLPATLAWAGAAEIGAACPVTMTAVADCTQAPGADLYRTFGSTIRSSIRRNRLRALQKGLGLFARLLAGMTRSGSGWRPPAHAATPLPAHYPPPLVPSCRSVMRLCGRIGATVAASRWARMRWREQWRIAYCFVDGDASRRATARWRPLVPPPDRLWADPFVTLHDGRHFIFFEELAAGSERGRIMATEVFRDSEPGPPVVALERPYHLSYPFMFRWNGALYMLPETGANHSIELYRCEGFPARWRLERVLIRDIDAYDATLCEAGGRWWMFVNVAAPGADCNDELHLYSSASPLGPWVPHRANPIVTDVRRARSAGPLFTCDGVLYRPSQDSSRVYGEAVSINRIDVLDLHGYAETPIRRINPRRDASVRCIHTVGAAGQVGVIDFQVRRRRW